MTQPLSRLKQAILSASKPTATLLIGVPGAGKSTWIKQAGLETLVISTDAILDAMALERGVTFSQIWREASLKDVEEQMLMNLQQAVASNQSFIVDRTNVSRSVRHKILSHIPTLHYTRYAAVFVLNRDELNKRLATREATGKIITPDVVDDMLNRYEPPSRAEFDKIFLG